MDPTDEEIQLAMDCLTELSEKVSNGVELQAESDALELDVDDGRIWVHPEEDNTVEIHLFDDTEEGDFRPARSRIFNHLTRELGIPDRGEYEPYSSFRGQKRMTIKADFDYF